MHTMSVEVTIKVSDGFALAADSATTLTDSNGGVVNIYNNAVKVVNLYKGLPLGLMFWDAGAIGWSSMANVAKDLRRLLTDGDPNDTSWKIDPSNYAMDDVADKVKRYFYDVRYKGACDTGQPEPFPSIGLYVCGFGTTDDLGREYEISIQKDGSCDGPVELGPGSPQDTRAYASPDPVFRLMLGLSLEATSILEGELGSKAQAEQLWNKLAAGMNAGFLNPAMPIKDAI